MYMSRCVSFVPVLPEKVVVVHEAGFAEVMIVGESFDLATLL